MLRYALRTVRHTRITWVFLILITVIWFWYDHEMTRMPLLTEDNLSMINASYQVDFETVEEAKAGFPAYMVERLFGFVFPRLHNGGAWMLLLLSSLLLARPLRAGTAQLPLVLGHSRVRQCLFLTGKFYLVVSALQGLQVILHLCNMGMESVRLMDWGRLLLAYLIQSISLCGFVSVSVIFAFWTQSALMTTLLSVAYLALSFVLAMNFQVQLPMLPASFDWTQSPGMDVLLWQVLVSTAMISAAAGISCAVYSRRDIRAGQL